MHELSICQSMLEIVDATMPQYPGAKLRRILLDVGMGSTVEPELLREAFEIVTSGGPYDGAELAMNIIPITGRCNTCTEAFEYKEMALGCPRCGSTDISLKSGLELNITQLEIDEPQRAGGGVEPEAGGQPS